MTVVFLALRNVILQRKRYLLMFLAIMAGFTLVVLVHSITYGALESMKIKAARYFSGHISITGYLGRTQTLEDSKTLVDFLENSELPFRTVSPRTVYYHSNASLFFGGESVKQRRLIGIDFQKEYHELSQLDFLTGSVDQLIENSDTIGILISEVAADLLGARLGDDITLFLTTETGQYNSATLIVQGIFRETSLFGYVAYMSRGNLNSLLLNPPDHATDIALYTKKGVDDEKLLPELRILLSQGYKLLPPVETKADLEREVRAQKDKTSIALAPLTLETHLNQITTVMDAVKIVTWFIQVLFMLIIMVGILNTYRVLVYERTKEIGTLRAMGMTRNEIRTMFLAEAFFLDIGATFSGFLLFRVILMLLKVIDISGLPGVGFFTERGHLIPHMDMGSLTLTFIFMMIAVLIAAWGPAERASRMSPVDAMREEN